MLQNFLGFFVNKTTNLFCELKRIRQKESFWLNKCASLDAKSEMGKNFLSQILKFESIRLKVYGL